MARANWKECRRATDRLNSFCAASLHEVAKCTAPSVSPSPSRRPCEQVPDAIRVRSTATLSFNFTIWLSQAPFIVSVFLWANCQPQQPQSQATQGPLRQLVATEVLQKV